MAVARKVACLPSGARPWSCGARPASHTQAKPSIGTVTSARGALSTQLSRADATSSVANCPGEVPRPSSQDDTPKLNRAEPEHQPASCPRRCAPRHHPCGPGRTQTRRNPERHRHADQKSQLECCGQQRTRKRPNQRGRQMLSGDPRPKTQPPPRKRTVLARRRRPPGRQMQCDEQSVSLTAA